MYDVYDSTFNTISEDIEKVVIKDCTLSDCFAMFASMKKLQSVSFDNVDTSNVTYRIAIFSGCESSLAHIL